MLYLIVFLGAGLGGALRHGVNVGAAKLFGFGFPYGTLIVNVAGSFVMGLLAGYFAFRPGMSQQHGCSSRPASSAASPPSRPSASTPPCWSTPRLRPRRGLCGRLGRRQRLGIVLRAGGV
jgi:Integral membrane protein possibly involved in chromosome condensation